MNEELRSAKNIIVRCPNWVGDIVMATPVFACIRENFPDANIYACVRKYARGIIEDSPWFDSIIACDDKTFRGFMQTVSETRALKPDLAIILPNSTHSFLTAKLGGARFTYGYKRNLRRFFLTDGPKPIRTGNGFKPLPMVDYYLKLCRYLDLDIPDKIKPRLFISSQLQKKGDSRLQAYGISPEDKVIGLNPGASFGSSKCWPPEHFAKLAELIEEKIKYKILLLVGPGEEEIAHAITEQSSANIINTAPDKIDLAELKPLVKRCDILVTNDTGPRHYAVAFDVPVVVLMGPTNPLYTAASLDHTIVLREDLDCAPCHKKKCPTDHRCMWDITPEKVIDSVEKLVKELDENK